MLGSPRLDFSSSAGEIYKIYCSPNPVGEGYFTTVSMVGKDWSRVSGPWPTKDAAHAAGKFALDVVDATLGRKLVEVSPDVAELRKLQATGAKFFATEVSGKGAIVWHLANKPGMWDTELRYPTVELAKQAIELAKE
jgi:hypothetical protein